MQLKLQYTNEEERSHLISQHHNLLLIEEQNIKEGNFLIFSDAPIEVKVVYSQLPKEEFDRLETQRINDNLITLEVLATIYEELLAKGSV